MNTYSLLAKAYEATIDDVLYAIYLSLVRKYTDPGRLLEAGCGTGYLSRELARSGYKVIGIDTNQAMLELARRYAALEQVDVTYQKHDVREPLDKYVDTVIMPFDVVNHLCKFESVKRAFENITNALNPKGILIFDALEKDFMDSLVGYEETIQYDEGDLYWTVKRHTEDSVMHEIRVGDEVASHEEYFYPENDILTVLSNYDLLERLPMEGRIIYVMRKKEE